MTVLKMQILPLVLYNGANHIVNFNYILLDVNRYDEQELYNMANLLSSVFIIDRTAQQTADITKRLRRLLGSLQQLKPEQFQQFTIWLAHVILPKLSPKLHPEIKAILQNAKVEEVVKMISNVEIVMEKERHRAFLEGELHGEIKGEHKAKLEIARKLLLRGNSMAEIIELTGLPADEIEKLAKTLQ